MTNLMFLCANHFGLIPDAAFELWIKDNDEPREKVRSIQWNVAKAVITTLAGIIFGVATIFVGHPHLQSMIFLTSSSVLAAGLCWFWPSSFGTSVNKLRELFGLSWADFSKIEDRDMPNLALTSLKKLAHQAMRSEYEHDRGSKEANKTYDKFDNAYILCELFDLAPYKRYKYHEGWEETLHIDVEKGMEIGDVRENVKIVG